MATVKELKAQAKSRGIKGFSTMRKAELEKALGGGEVQKKSRRAKGAPSNSEFLRTQFALKTSHDQAR